MALYGSTRGSRRWSYNERAIAKESRSRDGLALGRSTIGWEGDTLVVRIDERQTPFGGLFHGGAIRGTVVFRPEYGGGEAHALDERGDHLWWPVAPAGRAEVAFEEPSLRFAGHGYHDANAGRVPLEESFSRWTWSRARLGAGTAITYDAMTKDGRLAASRVAMVASHRGVEALSNAESFALPTSRWQLERRAQSDRGRAPTLHRSLEDGPFYARDLVSASFHGERVLSVHETLSLDRWRAPWVRGLAAFKCGSAR